MTVSLSPLAISDEMLVAHLDGELPRDQEALVLEALERDADVRARRDLLASGMAPFAEAFGGLLPAAPDRLKSSVAGMIEQQQSLAQAKRPLLDRRSLVAMAASAAILAPLGFLMGRYTRPDMENWREAVAQYHKLYSDKTLANLQDNPPWAQTELAGVGRELGLKLSTDWLDGVGIAYRRAQILSIDNIPLAQIALAMPDGKALAYCIRRLDGRAEAPQLETRAGLPVAHWTAGGFAFLVVGPVSRDAMARIGAVLHRNAVARV